MPLKEALEHLLAGSSQIPPCLNRKFTLPDGTQFQIAVYIRNVPGKPLDCFGFYAWPNESFFRFGRFQLEWMAGEAGHKSTWRINPRGWMYGQTSNLKEYWHSTKPTLEFSIDHLKEDSTRTEVLQIGWPQDLEFTPGSYNAHFEHTRFESNSKRLFQWCVSAETMRLYDGNIMGVGDKSGEVMEYTVTGNNQIFFVGFYDPIRSYKKGERYIVNEKGYQYDSGIFVNNLKHGAGIEFKVSNVKGKKSLSWLEGTWDNGRYHGEFLKRVQGEVITLQYSHGVRVGLAHTICANGTHILFQSVREGEKSSEFLLDVDFENSTLMGFIDNQVFSLPLFIQSLHRKKLHAFIEKLFTLISIPIAQEIGRELVKLGELWAPVHYFGQDMGAWKDAAPTKYSIIDKVWPEKRLESWVTQVLNDLDRFNKNPLTDGLHIIRKLLNKSITIDEIEAFTTRFPQFTFTKPKSSKNIPAAIQAFKDKIGSFIPWMVQRVELIYGVLSNGEDAVFDRAIVSELDSLSVDIEAYRQRSEQETQIKNLAMARQLVEVDHEKGRLELERESRSVLATHLGSFNLRMDDLKEKERLREKEEKRILEEAKRQQDAQRREERRLFERQQQLKESKEKFLSQEAARRGELSREEELGRSLLTQSFFVQKQGLPVLQRPLIETLLPSLSLTIKKKAVDSGVSLSPSQLLLIYQGMVIAQLKALHQCVVVKEIALMERAAVELNEKLVENHSYFKYWLEREAKFYAQGLVVFHLQGKKIQLTDLEASNLDLWLAPEYLLKQIERVAKIQPAKSLKTLFLMIIKLCLDKHLPISLEGVSKTEVVAELEAGKSAFDKIEVETKYAQMKSEWWGKMQESAEEYLEIFFAEQLERGAAERALLRR